MAGSTLYVYENVNRKLSDQERPDFNFIPEKMILATESTLGKKKFYLGNSQLK